MNRKEQLVFCKKCTNRQMDAQQGFICSLTGEKASFEMECPDFNLDESVKEVPRVNEPIAQEDVALQLSEQAIGKLRLEQNFSKAVLFGVVVGVVGAMLWGLVTVITNYQIGYMAIAIGAGVGVAMRIGGRGIDPIFGFTGAAIAVLSCFIGNFLSIIGFFANEESMGYIETLLQFDYAYFFPLMQETFSGMDLLFYGIAGYEGYKFSFRTITEEDVEALEK